MQDDGQTPMGGGGVIPVKMVIDSVVRNAMERLVEKQQNLRAGAQSKRRIEMVRYLEETRKQFVSLLGLLRWQKKRLPMTRKCEVSCGSSSSNNPRGFLLPFGAAGHVPLRIFLVLTLFLVVCHRISLRVCFINGIT